MEFNSKGMFRGVCESSGQCSVGIWEEMVNFQVAEIASINTEIGEISGGIEQDSQQRERPRLPGTSDNGQSEGGV